jgi:methylmalonyl-CoA mutase N-terminal domain/subunit
MRLVIDTIEFSARELPRWNPVSISGYHIREAGATATQELAFTLADGLAYVAAGVERGMDVDAFAPRLSFFFDVHNDFFEEIAKFRAARRLWARLVKERFGARDPASLKLRSSRTTTWHASRSRRSPPCSAARSRSTPTRSTRRTHCRRKKR